MLKMICCRFISVGVDFAKHFICHRNPDILSILGWFKIIL